MDDDVELGVKIVAKNADDVRRQIDSVLRGASGGDIRSPVASGVSVKTSGGGQAKGGSGGKGGSESESEGSGSSMAKRAGGGIKSFLGSQASNLFNPNLSAMQQDAALMGGALRGIPGVGFAAQAAFQAGVAPQLAQQSQTQGSLMQQLGPMMQAIALKMGPDASDEEVKTAIKEQIGPIAEQLREVYSAQSRGTVIGQQALADLAPEQLDATKALTLALEKAYETFERVGTSALDAATGTKAGEKEGFSERDAAKAALMPGVFAFQQISNALGGSANTGGKTN